MTSNALGAQRHATLESLGNDARFWDKIAAKYAASPVSDMAGYERTLARTADFLDDDYRVLEIGCGTGTTALKLAPYAAQLTATDISSQMIAIAKKKAASEGVDTVRFEVATADDTRFEGHQFDAVLAFNILHLVADLDGLLTTLRASLKPGGVLISKTPCLKEMNPLIGWVAIPVMRLLGKAPSVVHNLSPEKLEGTIIKAGFEILAAERHTSNRKGHHPYFVARRI